MKAPAGGKVAALPDMHDRHRGSHKDIRDIPKPCKGKQHKRTQRHLVFQADLFKRRDQDKEKARDKDPVGREVIMSPVCDIERGEILVDRIEIPRLCLIQRLQQIRAQRIQQERQDRGQ